MSHQPQPHQQPKTQFETSNLGSREPNNAKDVEGGMSRALMFGLIALALIASLLMVFTSSDMWLKVAVIAALWAAFIGLFLVLKYTNAIRSERQQRAEQDNAHRAQLEAEKSQHKQREAELESKFAQQAQSQRDEHLELLRAELSQMRRQLAELTGKDWEEEEQRAVRARAERVRELEGSKPSAAAAASSVKSTGAHNSTAAHAHTAAHASTTAHAPTSTNGSAGHPGQHRRAGSSAGSFTSGSFNTGTFAAVNWTGQDAEKTSQIPLIVDTTALDDARATVHHEPTSTGASGVHSRGAQHGQSAQSSHTSQPSHAAQDSRATTMPKATMPSPAATVGVTHHAKREDSDATAADGTPTDATSRPQAGGHGRRRADESATGLTVAELMKRFKQ